MEGLHGYLAGLFDGDGNITKNDRTGRWYVNVTNTVPQVLQLFVDIFGGSIHEHRRKGEETSFGIVSKKTIYRWYASGAVGMALAQAILPYLIIKRVKVAQAVQEKFGLHVWPPRQADTLTLKRRRDERAEYRKALRDRQRSAAIMRSEGASYGQIAKILGYKNRAGAFGAAQRGSELIASVEADP